MVLSLCSCDLAYHYYYPFSVPAYDSSNIPTPYYEKRLLALPPLSVRTHRNPPYIKLIIHPIIQLVYTLLTTFHPISHLFFWFLVSLLTTWTLFERSGLTWLQIILNKKFASWLSRWIKWIISRIRLCSKWRKNENCIE